ncbi:two-component sensor histidine kinase [Streptomyces pactum]|uniref:histidine kinase n=1 Tax=Streptomyces pactum TaxID=68249 RepID=A0ABS0NGZ9_9ACTN|nr:histidine kinase [Streptomyces pactum]MBH5334467.1 two-component sensor histidine kinase [Streptomyces pactum]
MSSFTVGPGLARPHRWLRAHPYALDTLVALGVFATVLVVSVSNSGHAPKTSPVGPAFVLISAAASAALVLRGRYPRSVLALTSALTAVELATGGGPDLAPRTAIVLSVVVALYTVASRTDRPTTRRIGAATIVAVTGSAMLFGMRPWYAAENLGLFAWTGMAAAAGDAVRSRRAYVAAIEERAVRAEQTREEEARRRVAEERLRIARELHDVVAHHIALVNVQAGVASHVMESRPDQAKQALAHVREASRSALDELRATVGLLRQYGDPAAPTEPAPGLGLLDQLVQGFVRTGLTVEVVMDPAGAPGPLPAAVDLTAYRVVQEALTNVHKHAGPQASARVLIVRRSAVLEVSVLDDGPPASDGWGEVGTAGRGTAGGGAPARPGRPAPPAARSGDGGGHGLIGMRERVAALGGECEAGPRPQGGFGVRVRLPLQARTGGEPQ